MSNESEEISKLNTELNKRFAAIGVEAASMLDMAAKVRVNDDNEEISKLVKSNIALKHERRNLITQLDKWKDLKTQLYYYKIRQIEPLKKDLMLSEETAKLVVKYKLNEPQSWDV